MLNKKSGLLALADVPGNNDSPKELIDQLRKVANAPPQELVPVISPSAVERQKTALEYITEVVDYYGEELATRFAHLYRNITCLPHKAFNPHTFTNAASHFLLLAVRVFSFWWLIRFFFIAGLSQNGCLGTV